MKMSKPKSDDGLEILEKLVKILKRSLLNAYFGCSSTSKQKNDSKTKKTTTSAPRLVKYKTVAENWIKKVFSTL